MLRCQWELLWHVFSTSRGSCSLVWERRGNKAEDKPILSSAFRTSSISTRGPEQLADNLQNNATLCTASPYDPKPYPIWCDPSLTQGQCVAWHLHHAAIYPNHRQHHARHHNHHQHWITLYRSDSIDSTRRTTNKMKVARRKQQQMPRLTLSVFYLYNQQIILL